MRWNGFLATTIAALLLAAAPAAADTFTVTGTGDGTGSCASGQCTTIRAALAAAAVTDPPDDINLPAGGYQLTQGALVLTSNVTLRGESARTTTLYAAPSSRVLEINGAAATISNLTVSGGVATDSTGFFGGNIQAASANVTLDHVRSTGGRAYSGGGIANRNGTMTISNSLIDHNSAPDGGGDSGGVLNFGGDGLAAANLTITNSTVAFNSARVGGGVMQWGNDQDSLTLQRVTIARNTASAGAPGGLNIGQGTGHVSGSIVAANQGPAGESNCAGTGLISDGFNVDSGTDCAFAQQTDRSDQDPGLDTELRNSGGQTDVLVFNESSPARDIGGLCAATDQTDYARAQAGACDAGAWELRGVAVAPTPTPTATPVATPTPSPTPVTNKSVEAQKVSGTVLVRPKGAKKFVPLSDAVIANGSEVDARKGKVVITTAKSEKATFYSGQFIVSQSGGVTTVTLSEALDCKQASKGKARAAAKKPKTRKLWGNGKGKFRTKGQYSAATVRGTKWLVQDTCTTTLTRVAQGVVSVRDDVKKKTLTLRKGKSYTARAKK